MSLDFPKFNRPGLGELPDSSSRAARSTRSNHAAQTSSTNSASSLSASASSRLSISSSLISNSPINGKYSTAGFNTHYKHSQYDYTNYRYHLNGSSANSSKNKQPKFIYVQQPHVNNANNNSAMTWSAIFNGAATLINAGANAYTQFTSAKAQSNGQKLDNATSGLNGGSYNSSYVSSNSQVSGAISSMASCEDSSSLRQAIVGAEDTLSQLKTDLQQTQMNQQTAKTNLAKSKDNLKSKKDFANKKADVVNKAKESVKGAKLGRDAKRGALKAQMMKECTFSAQYSEAHANAVIADKALADAQSALASTPQKIPGPNGTTVDNPQYKIAQDRLQQAQQAQQAAKQAEENAKTDYDKSVTLTAEQEKSLSDAEQALTNSQGQLDNAQGNLDNATAENEKANEEVKTAQQEVDNYDALIAKFNDKAELEEKIAKYKTKLTELEKKESEQYDKYNTKAQNNAAEKHQTQHDRVQAQRYEAKQAALQDNIAKTDILRKPATKEENGVEYRTGNLPSGSTVYFINNREVSKEEYENSIS